MKKRKLRVRGFKVFVYLFVYFFKRMDFIILFLFEFKKFVVDWESGGGVVYLV